MSKEFYARLAAIQENLNAPKNQYNSFGKYKYRSCEDILEGVKPLLNGLFLSISDEVVLIGDRYYVKATATITDGETVIRQPPLHERKKARKEWILHKLLELQALMHASIASMVCSALMMRKMQIQTSINISRTQQQSNQNHHLHLNRF